MVGEFLKHPGIFVDVRSPSEFRKAHIPSAINRPLFDDDERAQVGTVYKQEGQEPAIQLGLEIVGPKLAEMVSSYPKDQCLKLYCWRGGMRSQSMATLLSTLGYDVLLLKGGYKAFRRFCLSFFEQEYSFRVIGGYTGAGKTEFLNQLAKRGEQVLDLEQLAHHRGSSFGSLGEQPSTEQFENLIAMKLEEFDPEKPIWIEDESVKVGTCKIPDELFHAKQRSPLYFLESSKEERVETLLKDYGSADPEFLVEATLRITKKLGSEKTAEVVEHIENGRLREAAALILDYYDKAYAYSLKRSGRSYEMIHKFEDLILEV